MEDNNTRKGIVIHFCLEFKKNIFHRIEFLLFFSALIVLYPSYILLLLYNCRSIRGKWQHEKKNRDIYFLFSFRGIEYIIHTWRMTTGEEKSWYIFYYIFRLEEFFSRIDILLLKKNNLIISTDEDSRLNNFDINFEINFNSFRWD